LRHCFVTLINTTMETKTQHKAHHDTHKPESGKTETHNAHNTELIDLTVTGNVLFDGRAYAKGMKLACSRTEADRLVALGQAEED
jgi:hypothetical protein